LVPMDAICRDAALQAAVKPLRLQGVWARDTRPGEALVATRPCPSEVQAVPKATEAAGVGCPNLRRSILVTLIRVVVGDVARGLG